METNLHVVGSEALSAEKQEYFWKYDQSWIIASPSPHQGGLNPDYPANTKLIYDIDIVNNLFSFDLDKEKVLINKF